MPGRARSIEDMGAIMTSKIYAESFVDQSHLDALVAEAHVIVDSAMGSSA
jgi:hypothetical protein